MLGVGVFAEGVGGGQAQIAQISAGVRLENGGFLEVVQGVLVAARVEHAHARHEMFVADGTDHRNLLLAPLFCVR
jgi:hypothetical protein